MQLRAVALRQRYARVTALGLCLLAFILASGVVNAADATARACSRVTVGSIQAVAVDARNISCTRARSQIRRWIRQGWFPSAQDAGADTDWWGCAFPSERKDRRYLCSNGNGRGAPRILFRTRE
jgi:hypothetical protein